MMTIVLPSSLSDALSEGPGVTCKDRHEELEQASRGKASSCQEALQLYRLNDASCEDDLGFGSLDIYCPVTCGTCTPPGHLLDQIERLRDDIRDLKQLLKVVQDSTAAQRALRDPRAELKRFFQEIKSRYERGTLLKPFFDSLNTFQGLVRNLTSSM
mmetsp:Transcript_28547/g.39755  ORF Transcript_28547/g.39755 Transcript_28547/m.39755 type:complete len:157 (+) Transcript_28547:2-472(+)